MFSLEVSDTDIGTTSRVRLELDHDAEAPRKWFVKLPSRSLKARAITALPRLPQTEVRFYQELADKVPTRRPEALAAEAAFGRGYTLVLEDLTERGIRPGTPRDALDAEQAGQVCEALAGLHASHWESPLFERELAWLSGPVRRLEDGLGTALAVPLMRRGLDRATEVVPADLRRPALRYAKRRRQAMRFLASGPQTLIHHDCHPGNLYWSDEGPGLLDWQLVRKGEGIGDVAYLLATALTPEVRREHERALVSGYGEALAAAGVAVPDDLWERYRAHLSYAFEAMVVTLAVGDLMDEEVVSELIRRSAMAVAEQESFAVLSPRG